MQHSPTTNTGWPEPNNHGCPLLTLTSALCLLPSTAGTVSVKVPFFFSCSSLCLDQCKTQVRNQWHWPRTSFLWEAWGRMDTGAAQHTAKKWHCMQKISNIRDKAITWRALCSMQTSCCVMMLHTSRLFVTAFSFISPEVHSFYCCSCWIFINPSLTIPLLRSH